MIHSGVISGRGISTEAESARTESARTSLYCASLDQKDASTMMNPKYGASVFTER
jgi:hypothetical protein